MSNENGTRLKKEINALGVFSIAAGAMISSGLFILPAVVYDSAGSGIIFSYLFAGILMLPALFSQLELSTAIPKAGGTYFYSERILGTPAGVISGFADWFSISFKSAFALVGIGAFATLIFPELSDVHIKMISAGFCLLFGVVNLISVRSSEKFQIILVVFLIIILVLFIAIGYRVVDFERFSDMAKPRWKDILAMTGVVFISYGGLTKITSIAEEVKEPEKNIPKGALTAFIVVQLIYLVVVALVIGILPADELRTSLTPVTDSANKFFPGTAVGTIGMILTAVGAMLAFITTGNAGIMTASRIPMAMSRDGLLPGFFGKLTQKRKTPVTAILVTTAFMLIIIIALDIKNLAKVASLFLILSFLLVNVSVLVVRYSKLSNYKPAFKSPLFPVTQIVGTLCYIYLIIQMGWLTIGISLAFIAVALIWYFVYARRKVSRKSAFVHMVENITAPELREQEGKEELEGELLDILIERNEIEEDRFDRIIREAPAIDMDHTANREEVFALVAEEIEKKWLIPAKNVLIKLELREQESSTLLYPGVAVPHAIPHIIIEGEHKFDIVLVRNRFGIKWNEAGEVVYTAFCLIGSRDERNFHLRALMAIAQILQDPSFHQEWMGAKNDKEMRSALLLIKRKRS